MRRLRLTDSPLARPDSPIHKLAAEIQRHSVYLPSPDGLYVTLGTVAANMMKGLPVWLVLVGASSSGKTILLDMVNVDNEKFMVPHTISMDNIKGPAALLSGVSKKDAKGGTGGIMNQIKLFGILLIKDLTTMMCLPREALNETMGMFRRIYDGQVDRPVGTDGGKVLKWHGKMGLLSACTKSIDSSHSMLQELGQRWVYYRFDDTDGYGETMSALKDKDPQRTKRAINELVVQFFEDMGIVYSDEGIDCRELTDVESNRLYNIGYFSSRCRSAIKRNWRTNEIEATRDPEAPPRIAKSLGQLYLGLELIGLGETERWCIVRKIGLDSMTEPRLNVVKRLRLGPAKPGELKLAMGIGTRASHDTCEDLEMLGVIERVGRGRDIGQGPNAWQLTHWSKKLLKLGWGDNG